VYLSARERAGARSQDVEAALTRERAVCRMLGMGGRC